jgi:hypothetical protein
MFSSLANESRINHPSSTWCPCLLNVRASRIDNLYVKWAMEQDHKETRSILDGLMPHHRSGWEMGVRSGANDVAIRVQSAFEHNDRV